MADDYIRALVGELNNYWDRGKTLTALNELLKPKNIVLNVSGLIAILDRIDDASQVRKDNKTERFVKQFADLVESVMLNPPVVLRDLYRRNENGASAAMWYVANMGKGMGIRTIFDTQECNCLALYSAYVKLWNELGHKPSRIEINASDLTKSMSTYNTRFGSIKKMLAKYGDPANQ